MGLNRQDKAAVIEEVAGIVANSSSIVIAEYRGLSVEAVTKLRAEARKNNVTLRVVKNTLVRRAVEGTEFAGLADQFVGLNLCLCDDGICLVLCICQNGFLIADDLLVTLDLFRRLSAQFFQKTL